MVKTKKQVIPRRPRNSVFTAEEWKRYWKWRFEWGVDREYRGLCEQCDAFFPCTDIGVHVGELIFRRVGEPE